MIGDLWKTAGLFSISVPQAVEDSESECPFSCRSGNCYLNKGECNLNQSKHDSFVERVAKNNG